MKTRIVLLLVMLFAIVATTGCSPAELLGYKVVAPDGTTYQVVQVGEETPPVMATLTVSPTQTQQTVTPTAVMTPTQTVSPTIVITPTLGAVTPTATATPKNVVESYTIFKTEKVNEMNIAWTSHAMKDRGDGTTFYEWAKAEYPEWPAVEPANWPTAPNVPNPLADWFRVVNGDQVPDGVEIPDTGERNFCQVREGEWCTNVVAPGHYMLYTGDGNIPQLWDGVGDPGHALSIWNVGDVEARLDGIFFQGWRLTGRFWNGDALPYGIVALHSHAANNMHDLESALNPSGFANAGGNCSSPDGCEVVEHTVVIASGNAPLAIINFVTSK